MGTEYLFVLALSAFDKPLAGCVRAWLDGRFFFFDFPFCVRLCF